MRRFLSGSNKKQAALDNCSLADWWRAEMLASKIWQFVAFQFSFPPVHRVFIDGGSFFLEICPSIELYFHVPVCPYYPQILNRSLRLPLRRPARLLMRLLAVLKAHYSYMQRLAHTFAFAKHSHPFMRMFKMMRMRTFVTYLIDLYISDVCKNSVNSKNDFSLRSFYIIMMIVYVTNTWSDCFICYSLI